MKYEFKKIDDDNTELSYKDKKYTLKKDIALMKDLQSINAKAKTKMMIELSKQGISKKDLVIEKKENNKTYYDDSNIREIEEQFVQEISLEIFDNICKRYFDMGLVDLVMDIGLDEKDTEKFGVELISNIVGVKMNNDIPSETKKDKK